MSLGEPVELDKLGERDAVHVPVVVVKLSLESTFPDPGDHVRFTNEECTEVEQTHSYTADAIVDPFITDEQLAEADCFRVLVLPGRTTPVRHVFDIQPVQEEKYAAGLEELERMRKLDPDCAECWDIDSNGRVFRW